MRAVFLLRTDLFLPSPIFRADKEIRALTAAGVECCAVCWVKETEGLPEAETIRGIRIERVFRKPAPQKAAHLLRRYLDLRAVTRELADRAVRMGPDLLVAHDLEVLPAAVRAARSRGTPILYDAHEDWPVMVGETSRLEGWLASRLERRLCRRVNAVVTPSEAIAQKYRRWGLAAEPLHNAPYRDEVEPLPDPASVEQIRGQLGVRGKFVIGFAGTIAPNRGLELTIQALALLPEDVHLVVVGGPPEEMERLRGLARQAGVEGRVHLVGRVPRREVVQYTAAFDVAPLVLPALSANYLQGLPQKLYDYMGAGVPVLVSDVLPTLNRVAVEDAGCGVPVALTPEAVARAVRALMDDPGRRVQLGQSGRAAFVSRYAWDHQQETFFRILERIGVRIPGRAVPAA